jgi:hypothetical protein
MQRVCWLVIVLTLPAVTFGQDMKPDEMRKQLNNTLTQLKAAQDRKAELAADNARLAARVSDLEKELAAKNQQVQDLNEAAAQMLDRTTLLRSHYAAWQEFMSTNPSVAQRWNYFLDAAAMSGGSLNLMQSSWPLQAEPAPPPAGPRPVEAKQPAGAIPSTSATRVVTTTAKSISATQTIPVTHSTTQFPPVTIHFDIKGTTTKTSSATRPSTASKP